MPQTLTDIFGDNDEDDAESVQPDADEDPADLVQAAVDGESLPDDVDRLETVGVLHRLPEDSVDIPRPTGRWRVDARIAQFKVGADGDDFNRMDDEDDDVVAEDGGFIVANEANTQAVMVDGATMDWPHEPDSQPLSVEPDDVDGDDDRLDVYVYRRAGAETRLQQRYIDHLSAALGFDVGDYERIRLYEDSSIYPVVIEVDDDVELAVAPTIDR